MAASDDNALNAVPEAPTAPAALWLPGSALNCYEGDAALRSWLLTPGLLTQRIREAAGAAYSMRVLHEGPAPHAADGVAVGGAPDHLREIEMRCGDALWLYARTRVPAATLAAQPWLGRVGARTLGEALGEHDAVLERDPFLYALLAADTPMVARACAVAGRAPRALWVRRSAFRAGGAPFELDEVFLPGIGRP
jgi:chorismate-pyruvate lyase